MATPRDYSSIVFDPETIAAQGARYLEKRRENKGLGVVTGLPSVDRVLLPTYSGEMTTILGRPGHGKTGLMIWWARNRAEWIKEHKTGKVVVIVSVEQTAEELNAFHIAADNRISITSMAKGEITDLEWAACQKHAIGRRMVPFWYVSYSAEGWKPQIKIDTDAINGAIEYIKKTAEIDCIFVDYLQRLPSPAGAESKVMAVSQNLDDLKTIAARTAKAPIIVGAQARRECDESKSPPSLDDGQWTSNIEQSSDRVLSITRPSQYCEDGEKFGKVLVQGKNQALIMVLKQKLGPANKAVWIYFQPEYNKLSDLETQKEGRP
jgi:replicative DNA helicase